MNIEKYGERLENIICDLIENKGVDKFYSGYRGDFDRFCSNTVHRLKARYPNVSITMVLSYIPEKSDDPDNAFTLPKCFDGSVYLLERKVPMRLAIAETNRLLTEKVDYIVAGVVNHCGGAYAALEYAHKRKTPIISVIDGWEL